MTDFIQLHDDTRLTVDNTFLKDEGVVYFDLLQRNVGGLRADCITVNLTKENAVKIIDTLRKAFSIGI